MEVGVVESSLWSTGGIKVSNSGEHSKPAFTSNEGGRKRLNQGSGVMTTPLVTIKSHEKTHLEREMIGAISERKNGGGTGGVESSNTAMDVKKKADHRELPDLGCQRSVTH